MNALVVPTNRPDRLGEFLDAWRPWPWDKILIVEDAPESSGPDGDGERIHRYSWRDIDTAFQTPGSSPDATAPSGPSVLASLDDGGQRHLHAGR